MEITPDEREPLARALREPRLVQRAEPRRVELLLVGWDDADEVAVHGVFEVVELTRYI